MAGGCGVGRINSLRCVGKGRPDYDKWGCLFSRLNALSLVVSLVSIISMETGVEAKCKFNETSRYIPTMAWLELECVCPPIQDQHDKELLRRFSITMERDTQAARGVLYSNKGELTNPKRMEMVAYEMSDSNRDARKGRAKVFVRIHNVTAKDEGLYTCSIMGSYDEDGLEDGTKLLKYTFKFPVPTTPEATTSATTTTSPAKTTATTTTSSTTTTTVVALPTGTEKEPASMTNVYIALAISCFLVITIVVVIIFFVRVRLRRRRQKAAAEREKSLDGFEFGQTHAANYNLLHMPNAASSGNATRGGAGTERRNPPDSREAGPDTIPLLALSRARALSGEAVAGSGDEQAEIPRQQRLLLLDAPRNRPRPPAAATPPRQLSPPRQFEDSPAATRGPLLLSPGGYDARAATSRSYDILDSADYHYDSEPARRSRRYSVPDFFYDDYDDDDDDDVDPSRFHRRHAERGLPPRSLSQQSLHRLRHKRGRPRRSRSGYSAAPHAYYSPAGEQAQPFYPADPNHHHHRSTSPHRQAFVYNEHRHHAQPQQGYADLPEGYRRSPGPPLIYPPSRGGPHSEDEAGLAYHHHQRHYPASPPPGAVAVTGYRREQLSPPVVTVNEGNNIAYSDSQGYSSGRPGRKSRDRRDSHCNSADEVFDRGHCPHRGGEIREAVRRGATARRHAVATSDVTMTSEDETPMARVGGPPYGNDAIGERFADQPQARAVHQQPQDRSGYVTPAPPHQHHLAANSLPSRRPIAVIPTRHYYNTSSAPRQRTRNNSRSPAGTPQYHRERRRRSLDHDVPSADEGGFHGSGDPRFPPGGHNGLQRSVADTMNLLSAERRPGGQESQFTTATAPVPTPLNVPFQGCAPGAGNTAARGGGESGVADRGTGGGARLPTNTPAASTPYNEQAGAVGQAAGPRLANDERQSPSGVTNGTPAPPPGIRLDDNHRRNHPPPPPHRQQRLDKLATTMTTTTASDTSSPDASSRRLHPRRPGCREGSPAFLTTSDSDSDNRPTTFGNGRRMSPGRHPPRNRNHHRSCNHNNNFNGSQNRGDDHPQYSRHHRQRDSATAHKSRHSRGASRDDEISLRDIKTDNETRCKRPVSVNNNDLRGGGRTTTDDRQNDAEQLPVACAADLDANRRRINGGVPVSRNSSGRCPTSGLQKRESVTSRGSRSRGANPHLEERSRVEEPAAARVSGAGPWAGPPGAGPPGSERWAEHFGVEILPASDCSRFTENGHNTTVKNLYRGPE